VDARGVDPDPWAAVGATVVPDRAVRDADELEPGFDVITVSDVLEQTTPPIGLIAGLRQCLGPVGSCSSAVRNFAAMKLRWEWLRRSPQRFNDGVRPLDRVIQ
jgi:hypothetical protein